MLLENARELVTQMCQAMALKDLMHLISIIGTTELAQPLAPRQTSRAANVLWQPVLYKTSEDAAWLHE